MTGVKRPIIAVALITSAALVACGGDGESLDTLPLLTAAPTVPASNAVPSTTVPVVEEFYTIQQGDTLFGIAQAFGVTVDELISFNAISDPDAIQAGQRLKIPPASTGVAVTTTSPTSTVPATTTP